MSEQQQEVVEQLESEGVESPQEVSIEDEFLEYASLAESLQKRLDKLSARLLETPEAPVKASDLAALVGIIRGDVVETFKDQTNSCGALFVEIVNSLPAEDEGEGEEGEEEGDEELDPGAIQLYATLYANAQAFEGMAKQAPEEQKGGFQSMIQMNQDGMKLIEEQVGVVVKEAAEKWLTEAAAAAGVTTGS